jgi:hypothetical protein
MLVVSDGKDWTDHVPQIEFPYLQRMWGYYGRTGDVENVHLPNDSHDFGLSKREPLYRFIAKHFGLDIHAVEGAGGKIDESRVTIEKESAMYAFGEKGEQLPAGAIKGFTQLTEVFDAATKRR